MAGAEPSIVAAMRSSWTVELVTISVSPLRAM
jgi:hypothetical protein